MSGGTASKVIPSATVMAQAAANEMKAVQCKVMVMSINGIKTSAHCRY
ncbi:hypothetical protein predicted by Glimmer/Critica [Lactiplantibacillus plantarum]|nr:hypothetical protein predicted by Glimmer/Critica [Lactiplantibacillus plantarum]